MAFWPLVWVVGLVVGCGGGRGGVLDLGGVVGLGWGCGGGGGGVLGP